MPKPKSNAIAPVVPTQAAEKKGPNRPVVPDAARPHDHVTFAHLIQLGLIDELPGPTNDEA